MGISWIPQIRAVSSSTMKFFVVASALVAACMAEADPALFYAGYGYPYAYGLHAFAGKSAPCVNGANEPVPCAGAPLAYAGYPYAPVAYGKRDAEAEPEADAAYFGYGYPYAYAGVPFGSSTGLDPITQGLDPATQGYVPYYGYGYHGYYGKRSADAEADAAVLYGAYGYAGLPYAGYAAYGAYPYAYGAHPYVYGVPFGSSTGLDPITQGLDPVTQGVVTKRSADASVFYGAYPGVPFG